MRQLTILTLLATILFGSYPSPLENKNLSDGDNIFYYTEHFRIITGTDSKYISYIVSELKNIAEYVWQKETLSFRSPANSDINYIDVYIANSQTTSPEIGDVKVEPYIAGYSGIYPDNTPYIVMNPYITNSNFKSTFAHELFHTIQFSYFNIRQKDQRWWNENLWWIESTAKYVEYLVFPQLYSYISSANVWIDNPCNDIDRIDFKTEYSKVLLPIYIDDVSIIGRSFSQTDDFNSYLDFLDREVGMDELLFNISECIIRGECFENVNRMHKFPEANCENIGFYGIDRQNIPSNSGSNPIFSIKQLSTGDFAVVSKKRNLPNPLKYNITEKKETALGWNLLSNPGEKILNLENSAYALRDGSWVKTKTILPYEGYWYYTEKKEKIVWYASHLGEFPKKRAISLVSFGSLNILPESLDSYADSILWNYGSNGWSLHIISDKERLNLESSELYEIKELKASQGYFIYNIE